MTETASATQTAIAANTANKKQGLSLGRLSAVAQIALRPVQPPDAEIDLGRIYSFKQVRRTFRNLEELAESIKLNGLIEPLVVHDEGDGRFRIIVGERRYRAAPLAGLTKVPVIIKKNLNELQIRRLQVAENNDRDDLTPFEQAMGVIEDVSLYGTKEAVAIWNRGDAWVNKRVAVKRYAEPVRELLANDQVKDLETLHCLNQIYDAQETRDEFLRLAEKVAAGQPLTREEARNTLARLKARKQDQAELEQRGREGEQSAKTQTQEKAPTQLVEQRTRDAELGAASSGITQVTAAKRPVQSGAADATASDNAGVHAAAQTAAQQTSEEKEMWLRFLEVALPLLDGIGRDRSSRYLAELQAQLQTKSPAELLAEVLGGKHAGRVA